MGKIGTIDVNDITKTVTAHISITGYKRYRVKLYIGAFLIRLGIWIIGMKCKIETKE